jgi:hypothetical protein
VGDEMIPWQRARLRQLSSRKTRVRFLPGTLIE